MKVKVKQLIGWNEAYSDALLTARKLPKSKNPSSEWKYSVLYPEHSPIRNCVYRVTFEDIKSWITVHFVRHHIGCQPFVSTQRPDRTNSNLNRDDYPQGTLITMSIVLNAQSWINISRKRLCQCASKETREAWQLALDALELVDPELRKVCVRECVYRGFCPERLSCGYVNTVNFTNTLIKYRKGVINGGKESTNQGNKEHRNSQNNQQSDQTETTSETT